MCFSLWGCSGTKEEKMSKISGYTYSGTPNDQLQYVNTKKVTSGATALIVSLEDTNVTLTAGEVNVSAFKDVAGNPSDAYLYANGASVSAITEHFLGSAGFDKTGDKVYAIPINTDDTATPADPQFLPVGGEYRASPTTYTDGDATILQSDVNGYLKVATSGTSKYENAAFAETESEAEDSEFSTSVMYGMDTEAAATSQLRAVQVAVDNAGISGTPNVLVSGGIYKTSLDTYDDNDAVPFHFTNGGKLLTDAEVTLNDYTDDSNEFTVASSKLLAIGGIATTDTVDSGDVGAFRMSLNRNIGVDISEQSLTAVKISKDANANTVSNPIFAQISDSTTGVVVETAGTKKALNVNITDGTNDMPTMDANSRAGFFQLTDGTNEVVVLSDGSDALSNASNELITAGLSYNYNGTNWDRVRDIAAASGSTYDGVLDSFTNTAVGMPNTVIMGYDNTGAANAYRAIHVDSSGNVVLSSDIEIGAVEIKNATTEDRVIVTAANTGRAVSDMVLAVQEIGADGTVAPTGSLLTNAPFTKLTDGTNNLTLGTGTVKTLPCELNDGSTKITFGTGTTKNVPVGLNDGTTAITFGTGTQKTVPTAISDGTTEVDVIATINSIKSDLSSIAGTATVTAGVNGLIAVGGNIAHDSADAGYPIKVGGKAATTKPTAVSAADRVDAYFDEYGRLHTIDEGGSSTMPASHISPIDFAAAYTSNVTITCSGAPFTVEDASVMISYIMYKPTAGSWTTLVNGTNGVSMTASANVITVTGAGTPFASGDTYRVGLRYQDKSYTSTTNSLRVEEISPITSRYEEISLVDTTNVAASQQWYPSSDGMLMDGYKNLSLTGKYIDGDAVTSTITVYVTNDEDATAANRDWIQVYGYDSKNNTFVNSISNTTAGTLTFSWDFDNLNYKYVRVGLLPGDATNTAIIKARRNSL